MAHVRGRRPGRRGRREGPDPRGEKGIVVVSMEMGRESTIVKRESGTGTRLSTGGLSAVWNK